MTRKQKIALAVAVAILVPASLLATATYCVVDVRAGGDSDERIFLPVPLALIEATLWLTPEDATRFQVSELAEYQALLAAAVEDLATVDEATLVSVETPSETVLITKEGADLALSVSTPNETVRVRVPLAVVAEIVSSYDGDSFGFAEAASALRDAPGELVYVMDAENEVRISIW